jgi:hypothetical protein
MKYQAKLINQAHVMQIMEFDADTPIEAYAIANDGIEPLSGIWVETRIKPQPQSRPDPSKLAAKPENPDALRKSFSPDQGNAPKDSSCAPAYQGEYPKPAGYLPAFKKSIME